MLLTSYRKNKTSGQWSWLTLPLAAILVNLIQSLWLADLREFVGSTRSVEEDHSRQAGTYSLEIA